MPVAQSAGSSGLQKGDIDAVEVSIREKIEGNEGCEFLLNAGRIRIMGRSPCCSKMTMAACQSKPLNRGKGPQTLNSNSALPERDNK
jgi:hypothetical protein